VSAAHGKASVAAAFAVLAGLVVAPFWLASGAIDALSLWAVAAIAAVGLNLTLGLACQVSLAQGAFMGFGAYAAALLGAQGWPLAAAAAAGGLGAMAVAWPVGVAATRTDDRAYLPMLTLAFAVVAYLVLQNEAWLSGAAGAARRTASGRSAASARDHYHLCLLVLCLATFGVWWIARSPWGRALQAIRTDPMRAASLGVDVPRYRQALFALGAALGGVAGALYAPLVQPLDPQHFDPGLSVRLLLMVVIGGSGTLLGPWLGAALAVLAPAWLGIASGTALAIQVVLAVALLALCPSGLIGMARRAVQPLSPEAGLR
jgi:branched-chain amino acid transport system permease protein